jgi:adenine specific DNA methylase Mod
MPDNILYYGDNLDILRRHVKDESVDLVYLDPPFNSNQDYNVLFREHGGKKSASQIKAFEDTWRWDEEASRSYQEVVEHGGEHVAKTMQAFRQMLGENDMLAYLSMMAPRLVELRRVLKQTGSIYLHCDSNAAAHLRLLMDSIFGVANFQNEIIWKRTTAHSDTKQGNVLHMGRIHDVLLYYTKTNLVHRNEVYTPYSQTYMTAFYKFKDDDGRRYRLGDITGPGGAAKGNPKYEFLGVTRYWRYTKNNMGELYKQGRIIQTKPGGVPAYKRYLDEMPGIPLQDFWDDISPIAAQADERLGYPTQKPEALLDRIIRTSSNEGDVVLDPFCGCGTAIAVANNLKRAWVGIDITHLAISLIKHRLKDAFGKAVSYSVKGEPVSLPDARELAEQDRFQFQFWALGLVGARPIEEKKGADKGIDGRLFFHDDPSGKTKQIIFSVKSGKVSHTDVRDLRGVIDRENAEIGVLITLEEPTKPMVTEAASGGFFKSEAWHKDYPRLQLLTIEELLNGKEIQFPPSAQVNITFKKAPKAKGKKGGEQAAMEFDPDKGT